MVSLLTVNAVVNKLLEVFAPYMKKKIKKKIFNKKVRKQNILANEIEKESYTLDDDEVNKANCFNKMFIWIIRNF